MMSGVSYFIVGDVGVQIQFFYIGIDFEDGSVVVMQLCCDIILVESGNLVIVIVNRNIFFVLCNIVIINWYMVCQIFVGFDYFEGQIVNVLFDVSVELQKVVIGGVVMLEKFGVVVYIGLLINVQFEILDININGQEMLFDKKQLINFVMLVVNVS